MIALLSLCGVLLLLPCYSTSLQSLCRRRRGCHFSVVFYFLLSALDTDACDDLKVISERICQSIRWHRSHLILNSASDLAPVFEELKFQVLLSRFRIDCQAPPATHYINNCRHWQSIFHASYFVVPQSGKILSLISLLSLIWGNNLVSSNPITADFPPQEWLELKFHCLLEDFRHPHP